MNNRSSSSNNSRRRIGGTNSNNDDNDNDYDNRALRPHDDDAVGLAGPSGASGRQAFMDASRHAVSTWDDRHEAHRDILRRSDDVVGNNTVVVSISNLADVDMDVAARGLRKVRKALPDYGAFSLPAGVPMGMRVVPDVPANVVTVRQAAGSGRDNGRDNGRDILRRSGEVSGDDTVAVSIRDLGGMRTGSLFQLLDEPVDVLPDYGPLQFPPDGPVGMLAVQEVPDHAAAAPQSAGSGHHNGRDNGRRDDNRDGRAAHQLQRCGNCNGINHTIAVCVHPAPDGFVHGCPICNSGSHESVDLCPKATRWPKTAKKQKWVDLAIKSRGNRPPLAAAGHWLDLLERACQDNLELPAAFPWMPGFLTTLADRFQPEAMPWVGHDYVADLPRSLPVDDGTLDIDTIMSNIDVLRAGLTGALNARVHQGPWPVWNGRHDALPRRL